MSDSERVTCSACEWPVRKNGVGGLDDSCWAARSLEGTALCCERTVVRLAKRIAALEAERHDVWAAGYNAGARDQAATDRWFDDGSEGALVKTENPYLREKP